MDHGHDTSASMDAADMSHGGSSHDMGMMTIFFSATDTALYSEAWRPGSAGAYAATCIFLIALAALLRGLVAGKYLLEQRWLDAELRRRYVVVAGRQTLADNLSSDSLQKQQMTLSANGVEERVQVVERRKGITRPWRFSVDPVRACLDVVIAGVGYLLMLAVMSMNVGYFLSVLAGVFVGSLAVGRYTVTSEH